MRTLNVIIYSYITANSWTMNMNMADFSLSAHSVAILSLVNHLSCAVHFWVELKACI